MNHWDNALDASAVFCVLLRTAITNHLCETGIFNQFFERSCEGTKKNPACNKPLNTG